jgi:endonuclease VIII
VLAGRTLLRVQGVRATPALRRLAGLCVTGVEAVGKHLLVRLSDGSVIRSHMRMSGSWHLYRPGERWQRGEHRARLVLETAEAVAVCFDAPTIELIASGAFADHPVLSSLGPDVLADDFSIAEAVRRWRALGDLAVGEALLDQSAVSGIGNIYKSESLHRARIHPFDPVSGLSDRALEVLAKAARRLLVERAPKTRAPPRASPHAVYDRKGLPCPRCGTPIERRPQGRPRRSTYFCAKCQAPSSPHPT